MISTAETMRRVGKRNFNIPFQKGIIISSKSLLSLYEDLSARCRIEFLLTSHLNQDCLENFFSRIRALGGTNTHPTSVDFINRTKSLIVGRSSDLAVETASVRMEDDCNTNESPEFISQFVTRSITTVPENQGDLEDVDLLSEKIPAHSVTASSKFPSFDCEAEGLKYVGGYIASKFLEKFPELGQKTAENSVFAKSFAPWIAALSRGSLVVPSENFMSQIYEMEKIFQKIHRDSISNETGIIKKFHQILVSTFPSLPSEVLKKFARTRTFIRIRFLNCQMRTFQVLIFFCKYVLSPALLFTPQQCRRENQC